MNLQKRALQPLLRTRIPEFYHMQNEIVDDVIASSFAASSICRCHNGGMQSISLKALTSQNCKQLLAAEIQQNLDLVQPMVQSIVQSRVQSLAFTDTLLHPTLPSSPYGSGGGTRDPWKPILKTTATLITC